MRYRASNTSRSIRYSKMAVLDPLATSRHIFVVPVREQHHDDLQTVQLAGADERVVVPRPAVLVEVLDDARLIELEARVLKTAVLRDALTGALQRARTFDAAGRHEIVHLDEVTDGPREPRRERLRCALRRPTSHATNGRARRARTRTGRSLFHAPRRIGTGAPVSRPGLRDPRRGRGFPQVQDRAR